MYRKYFVTGATGFLGGTVVRKLIKNGCDVRVLVMPGDRLEKTLPSRVEKVYGSIDKPEMLAPFFDGCGVQDCVIHCAGIVSIASVPGTALYNVNVVGTKNIVELCRQSNVGKLVYVSSVHAIPEQPMGKRISEIKSFSTETVSGMYAKTKAEATSFVLAAAKEGLHASVVHPSGIIGPEDNAVGSITGMISSYISGKLPVGVRGGYDFVDVRDVAEGILACCEHGRDGECYILSNRKVTVREMLETLKKLTKGKRILMYIPLGIAKMFAPLCEKISLRKKKPLFFTPYAIETLGVNADFTHEKAARELGYNPRPLEQTLSDVVLWMKSRGKEKA